MEDWEVGRLERDLDVWNVLYENDYQVGMLNKGIIIIIIIIII